MLKTKITTVPERYKGKLTEHIFKSPDYSLREKGAQMVRGKDGKFRNPLKPETMAPDAQTRPPDRDPV